jgi:BirA family biotin operon repressor/biotin-[acetyl-CoA-carboxylase] ligase
VSDEGGLWLSAVVPIRQKTPSWRFLPVAVGFAVCVTLDSLGAKDLRLRWPNDVLAGRRKLAGLLLDQFCPDLVVAGIGVNVSNRPEILDESLTGQTERLSALISRPPSLSELAVALLSTLRNVIGQLETNGPECLVSRVNALWQAPRTVRLDLDERQVVGEFTAVDAQGRLELRQPNKPPEFFEPHQVRCLREIDIDLTDS